MSTPSLQEATDLVARFIASTLAGDEAASRAMLARADRDTAKFNEMGSFGGFTTTVGQAREEAGRAVVPVDLADGAGQGMKLEILLLVEDGGWKIDLAASTERMFGGLMEGVGAAVGKTLENVLQGVGQALSNAFAGLNNDLAGSNTNFAAPSAPAAPKPAAPASNNDALDQVLKTWAPAFEVYAKQLSDVIGRPVTLDVDWSTIKPDDPLMVGQAIGYGYGHIAAGVTAAANDPANRADLQRLGCVKLACKPSATGYRLDLDAGTLTVTTGLAGDPGAWIDPSDTAAKVLALLRGSGKPAKAAKKAVKKAPAKKTPAKTVAKKSPPKKAAKKVVKKKPKAAKRK